MSALPENVLVYIRNEGHGPHLIVAWPDGKTADIALSPGRVANMAKELVKELADGTTIGWNASPFDWETAWLSEKAKREISEETSD